MLYDTPMSSLNDDICLLFNLKQETFFRRHICLKFMLDKISFQCYLFPKWTFFCITTNGDISCVNKYVSQKKIKNEEEKRCKWNKLSRAVLSDTTTFQVNFDQMLRVKPVVKRARVYLLQCKLLLRYGLISIRKTSTCIHSK